MSAQMWLFVISVFLSVLLVGLSIPLIRRRIPPNHWYGLRVSATFADEYVWYEANAVAGEALLKAGIAIFGVSLLLLRLPLPFWATVLLWVGAVEIAIWAAVFHSWRYANRLLQERSSHAGKERTR